MSNLQSEDIISVHFEVRLKGAAHPAFVPAWLTREAYDAQKLPRGQHFTKLTSTDNGSMHILRQVPAFSRLLVMLPTLNK